MAGKHAASNSSFDNRKKIIIIVIIALVIAGLITGGIIFFINNQKKPDAPTTATTVASTQQTTAVATGNAQTGTSAAQSSGAETKSQGEAQSSSQTSKSQESVPDIVVPTHEGVEVTYFNASYIPNGEAKDVTTGESVSLRDALGTGYAEGALTFNDDGTFTDTVMTGVESSGRYVVQGDSITATYADDRNMEITVTSWSNGAPEQFSVNYGGCIVYFG